MALLTKVSGTAVAALLASTVASNAAIIDFTANSTGLSGMLANGITWEVTASHAINQSEAGPGATGVLAGENDGIGVKNDEITYPTQWVKVTFSEKVSLLNAYFLDVFFGKESESGAVSVNGPYTGPDGEVFANVPTSEGVGYAVISGPISGTEFSFFAGSGVDDKTADVALAAIEVAAVPLPASALLLLSAVGGMGVARRKFKKA